VRLARAEFATTQPWDMYIAETWQIERRACLDGGDAEGARAALRGGLGWIEAALADVPDEFRDSFRNRNPVNEALLTARAPRSRAAGDAALQNSTRRPEAATGRR